MEEIEQWRRVADFPDYSVSSFGRVRRDTRGKRTRPGLILKGGKLKGGYRSVTLSGQGRKRLFAVHRLICWTFHGPKPTPKHQAAHWDGNVTNDRATNLRWATAKENADDALRLGRTNRGTRANTNRLSEVDVATIRSRIERGDIQRRIAEEFNVTYGTISAIKHGRIWRWLP